MTEAREKRVDKVATTNLTHNNKKKVLFSGNMKYIPVDSGGTGRGVNSCGCRARASVGTTAVYVVV